MGIECFFGSLPLRYFVNFIILQIQRQLMHVDVFSWNSIPCLMHCQNLCASLCRLAVLTGGTVASV